MGAMNSGAFAGTATDDLGALGAIKVRLSVEVGVVELTLREVMAMEVGAVHALDRRVDDPVEVHVNGRLVARGEIVSIGERFGVRLVDIVAGLPVS